jgi:hypothetical protein
MKGVDYMDTENKNVNLDEQMSLFEDEVNPAQEPQNEPGTTDALKGAIEETMSKIRRQSMLLGAQVMLRTILDKITVFERKPGSKSNNDHKRLIKEIKQFVEKGLARKMNENGEIEVPESETVQN